MHRIIADVILINGVADDLARPDVDHGGEGVLAAVGNVLVGCGGEHGGEKIARFRPGHRVKAHDADSVRVQAGDVRVLDDVFVHNAVFHLADLLKSGGKFLFGGGREDADALALALAVGLEHHLALVPGQLPELFRGHIPGHGAAASVKIGKDL